MNEKQEEVENLAGFFKRRIGIGKIIVVIVFGYLAWEKIDDLLKDVTANLPDMLLAVKAQILNQLALILYSSSWAIGMFYDVDFQQGTYAIIHNRARIEKTANRLMVVIVVGFVCACFAMTLPKLYFWTAMLCFCAIDIISWRLLMRKVLKPTYEASKNHYVHEKPEGYVKNLMKLEITRSYVAGHWKIQRYIAMVLMVLIGIVFSLKPDLYQLVATKLNAPVVILPSIMLLAYVIVAEAWMWFHRIQCHLCHNKINELLTPKQILWKLEIPGDNNQT